MQPIMTKIEAWQRGLRTYWTGRECGRGHLAAPRVPSDCCVECERELYHAKKEQEREAA